MRGPTTSARPALAGRQPVGRDRLRIEQRALEMAERGRDYRVRGDMAAFAWLPASVRRIFVLRDTPTNLLATPDCVRGTAVRPKVRRARTARSRASAPLVTDPTVVAAAAEPRARVIDLSPFFCSSRRASRSWAAARPQGPGSPPQDFSRLARAGPIPAAIG